MKEFTVYKHTTPSGKVYIGITSLEPKDRWDSGHGYRANKHFWSAIQKYGWNNITHEILFTGLSQDEAEAKEIELIDFYKSTSRDCGYNKATGGMVSAGYKIPKESILKRIETRKKTYSKENHVFYGKHLSETHRKRIGEANKGKVRSAETKIKIRNANLGKKLSEETISKMVESIKGIKPSQETIKKWKESNRYRMKPIVQIDCVSKNTIGTFESVGEASLKTGIDASSIRKCCKGKRKTAGNYLWEYIN